MLFLERPEIKKAIKMISLSTFYTFKRSFPLEFKWLGTLMAEMLTTNENWTNKLLFNTFRKRI
jgi:hypothetical protein